jgi:hypothetical protein
VNWDALSAAVRRRSSLRWMLRGASDAVRDRDKFGQLESEAQAGGNFDNDSGRLSEDIGGLWSRRLLHGYRPELAREAGPDAGVVVQSIHIRRVPIVVELAADHILRMIGNELAAARIDRA